MWINGRFLNEPEIESYISKLANRERKAEELLRKAMADIAEIRPYINTVSRCTGVGCESCPYTYTDKGCKWRYADEVNEFLGGK